MFHCKIFSSSQCHIRNQQTFYRRIFSGIHETDDTVECTSIREHILEIEVVVVGHTHTTQDNFVSFGTESHIRHYLVERLVRVSKERNLLTGHQRIVQVDTCNTGSNQFRRLLTTNRVHRRTTDFDFLTFNVRTTVNRITERIEETASQLFAHLQAWRLAQEHHFGIGRNTFCTLEYLQCHFIAHDLYHLGQLTIYSSQFIIAYTCRLQRTSSLGNLTNLGIYLLKSFCCHYSFTFSCLHIYFTLLSAISSCNCFTKPSYFSDLYSE